jgi:phage I-like protein
VLWTADAANAIGRREFRYLSPVLRFNAPDRVSGEPTPMMVHSVALTNTPFLTELASLNESRPLGGTPPRPLGAKFTHPAAEGDKPMRSLESLAAVLGKKAEEVASEFGLAQAAGDADVANALGALAARVNALREDRKRAEAKLAAGADEMGIPITLSPSCRGFPYVQGDSRGNAYIIWSDVRDGSNAKIYYLKIEPGTENDTNLPNKAICLTKDTPGTAL